MDRNAVVSAVTRAIVLAVLVYAADAAAQRVVPASDITNENPAKTEPASGRLEEIVVTAERRATRLEETPVAVTAFTPESIERNRIQTLEDIALRAPSVSFVQFNKGEAYISIRGTLVNTPGAGWDDSVTVFIDDIPMTGSGDNAPDLYDLKSIEVLRGPQGTLFGRNVTGGAIDIHTQEPSFSEHGKVEVTYGLDNLAQVRGLWTGPLIGNTLAGKVTLDVKRRDNYLNNVTLSDKTYGDGVGDVRGQLLWLPSDSLSATFSGDYTHDQSSGKVVQLSANLQPILFPNLSYGPYDTNQGQNSASHKNILGLSAHVDWINDWGTFSSISGLRDVRDSLNLSRIGDPENQALTQRDLNDKQYTQEFRTISTRGRLTWLAGLFYLHANKHDNEVDSYNLNPGTINGGAFPVPIIGVLQEVDQRIVDEVGAIFGEVSYAIVGPLRLTLGGRGQWERKSGTSTDLPSFTPGVPFNRIYPLIFATASADYADTWRSFTPKATLDYQANDRWLIYATTAKGYKSGGWDTSAASDYGKSAAIIAKELGTPFKPETVWSYELGSKYEGADKRFVANAAAFIADYSDMQDNQFNPATGVFVTSNVAKARVKGVEIEATDAATSWLTLGISYTYELARYSQYVVSATQNNTGNIIPLAPRHNIHLSAETNFSIPSVPGTMNFGGDYTYRTQVHFTDGNSEAAFLLDQSKFEGIANLHATWNSERNNWHVSLFSTNVTDRHSVVYATDVSGFYLTPAEAANSANKIYSVIRIPTRVVGVTLRHDF